MDTSEPTFSLNSPQLCVECSIPYFIALGGSNRWGKSYRDVPLISLACGFMVSWNPPNVNPHHQKWTREESNFYLSGIISKRILNSANLVLFFFNVYWFKYCVLSLLWWVILFFCYVVFLSSLEKIALIKEWILNNKLPKHHFPSFEFHYIKCWRYWKTYAEKHCDH